MSSWDESEKGMTQPTTEKSVDRAWGDNDADDKKTTKGNAAKQLQHWGRALLTQINIGEANGNALVRSRLSAAQSKKIRP